MPAAPASLESRIDQQVIDALALPEEDRSDALLAIAEDLFAIAYDIQTEDDSPDITSADVSLFTAQLARALEATTGESGPEAVAGWIATAAWNAATLAAAPSGSRFTWRTEKDERVRDIHVPLEGVSQVVGSPFLVGGVALRYPGEPIGPPQVWINCRCWLDLDANLVAAISEEPWSNFSASDYSIEQWRRACLITMPGGDPESKSTYKLPIRTPSGALSRAGVHAAWAALRGARGGVSAPESEKAKARAKIRSAYKTLGEDPPEGMTADAELTDPSVTPEEEPLVAAPVPVPADTHDAPGWITHPRETQRLRDYWTKGEGALKIRWGTPNDLTRCERHLRKYVGPLWSWATCQNLHHVVFKYFNPESRGRRGSVDEEQFELIAAAFAASEEDVMLPKKSYFTDPKLAKKTPMTVRAAGDGFMEYVGHMASWDQCHVGYGELAGQCVIAPRSQTNYAHFRMGEVETDEGPVAVGHITAGTGHADEYATATAAVAHYDNTGYVAADVAAGEDMFGIWAHGIVRPGASEEQVYALRAGAPSGDWRRIGGNLELVSALIVNVPGFPIPHPQLAMSASGMQVSLTAAGIILPDAHLDIAEKVVEALERAAERKAAEAEVQALLASIGLMEAEELMRQVEALA